MTDRVAFIQVCSSVEFVRRKIAGWIALELLVAHSFVWNVIVDLAPKGQ